MDNHSREYIKQLTALKVNMEKLQEEMTDLASNTLLAHVKKRTPVGVYLNKQGGTLRRNWKKGNKKKTSKGYSIEVYNETPYARHVNYGHKTRNGGYVKGQFMLEKAVRSTRKVIDKEYLSLIQKIEKDFNQWYKNTLMK